MKAVELPHLSICAPCCIAGPGVTQVSVGELVEPAGTVKDRSPLISDRLVVDEAACTRRVDGFFVQAHRLKVTVLDPGNFSAHQRGAVFEIIRAILHPDFKL